MRDVGDEWNALIHALLIERFGPVASTQIDRTPTYEEVKKLQALRRQELIDALPFDPENEEAIPDSGDVR